MSTINDKREVINLKYISQLIIDMEITKMKQQESEEQTIAKMAHIANMRGLYYKIFEFEGDNLYNELLLPWLEQSSYLDFINEVANNLYDDHSRLNGIHTTELYALTRVLDILTLPLQESCTYLDNKRWKGHSITVSEYTKFVESLGLQVIKPNKFHPFESEVFEAKFGTSFEIIDTIFPAVMLNNLMIKRAGVFISIDNSDILKNINTSTMYWTFRRNNRPCEDLSHGWGSNSQWSTRHRIDLKTKNGYVYNQTGEISLNVSKKHLTPKHNMYLLEDNLSINDGIELVRYRQLISKSNSNEFFPYHFKYIESTDQTKS